MNKPESSFPPPPPLSIGEQLDVLLRACKSIEGSDRLRTAESRNIQQIIVSVREELADNAIDIVEFVQEITAVKNRIDELLAHPDFAGKHEFERKG